MWIRCRGNVFTEPFPTSGHVLLLIKICCLAANVVSLFVSRSPPRNGSICRNIKVHLIGGVCASSSSGCIVVRLLLWQLSMSWNTLLCLISWLASPPPRVLYLHVTYNVPWFVSCYPKFTAYFVYRLLFASVPNNYNNKSLYLIGPQSKVIVLCFENTNLAEESYFPPGKSAQPMALYGTHTQTRLKDHIYKKHMQICLYYW
jgi:hypothetical protein